MFGNLGFSELLFIFVVALIVFGPQRLPDIARSIGKALGQFRRTANDLRDTVEREVQVNELRDSVNEVRRIGNDPLSAMVEAPKAEPSSKENAAPVTPVSPAAPPDAVAAAPPDAVAAAPPDAVAAAPPDAVAAAPPDAVAAAPPDAVAAAPPDAAAAGLDDAGGSPDEERAAGTEPRASTP